MRISTVPRALMVAVVAVLALASVVPASARPHHPRPFSFGIYPGGFAGGGSPNPKPDDQARVIKDLDVIQGGRRPFLVREYTGYDGSSDSARDVLRFLPYLGHGRKLDLVAGYSGGNAPIAGYLAYIRNIVRAAGPVAADISLGVDVNLSSKNDPCYISAVAAGVIEAKKQARRLGFDHLRIGFDEVTFGTADTDFWTAIGKAGGAAFRRSIDYVGVEVYPDIFRPQPGDHGAQAVAMLETVRHGDLPAAGLSHLPIHVVENGWPTTPDHTAAAQAATIRSEVTAIYRNRERLGVDDYELFALRDNVTGTTDPVDNLGLSYDDYTRKPAFDVYRRLVRGLR